MTSRVTISRAGPLTSIQDEGRFGMLRHGVSASGPMDRGAFMEAGALADAGPGGVEFTLAGLEIQLAGKCCRVGFSGGAFIARHNGKDLDWPGSVVLRPGDVLAVTPGAYGNYGYLRFSGDIAVPLVMGSMATSSRARIGGLDGRVLHVGDEITVTGRECATHAAAHAALKPVTGPIRFTWGLHAELFAPAIRERFCSTPFAISRRLDRLGVGLDDPGGVFAGEPILSLTSDAVVPGDVQILGDGSPIVLMRDHQPTGGYPRIATIISADLDRFAQMRPGTPVAFQPVSVEHAQALLRSRGR